MISFLRYMIHPGFIEIDVDKNLMKKLLDVFCIFLLLMAFTLVSIFIKTLFIMLGLLPAIENIGYELSASENSLIKNFFVACILGPIIEEFAFRCYLIFNPVNISISISLLYYFFLHKPTNIEISSKLYLILKILTAVIIFISVFLIISNNRSLQYKLKYIWEKYFLLIFYLSLILFVIPHLKNYNFNYRYIVFSPIFLLPQIFGGYSFIYVRLKYGIIFSILLHMISNMLPFIIINS